MSWFFKVARGWAPYSKEQSDQLELGFQLFQAGNKDHVVLDQWRIDLEKMIQYRADDPARSRPVKREGPAVPSSSSSSAPQQPAKRQKLLMQLVEITDEELFSDLGPGELKQVSDRLAKLQAGCAGRMNAAVAQPAQPGNATEEKDLVWVKCEFSTGHGKALYSPVLFKYARLFARIGSRPVLFQIRASEIINAEAEYNAYKLSYLTADGAEGELIWPPAPYEWSKDGEHDPELCLMPLAMMEGLRSACGVTDVRPANQWFQAMICQLVAVLQKESEKAGKDPNFDMAFEELAEWTEDYFNHLPESVMTMAEYFKQKEQAENAAAPSGAA